MNCIIRKKEIKDCSSIEKVITKSWQQTYKGIINQETLDNLFTNEEERIHYSIKNFNNNDYETYVLEVNKQVVGFVNCGESREYKNTGEIFALYIIEEYQGYGYGTELFLNAYNCLKNQGYNKVIVGCIDKNKSNKFYENIGCIKIGTRIIEKSGQKFVENIYVYN